MKITQRLQLAKKPVPTLQSRALGLLRKLASSPASIFVPGSGYLQTLENKLTWSLDFSNAAWVTEFTASKSGNTLLLPATSDDVYRSSTVSAGTYTLYFLLSGSGTVSLYAYNATNGIHGATQVTLTSTPTVYAATITSTVANSAYYLGRRPGDTATSVVFGGGGLSPGSFTGPQVASLGIPWTMATASVSLSLGPELVTNGAGDSLSGWTNTSGNWAVSAGRFVNVAGSGSIEQTILSVGKAYYFSFEQVGSLANTLNVFVGSTNFTQYTIGSQAGYKSLATTASGDGRFIFQANGANTVIDNLSCREILSVACPVYTDAHVYLPGSSQVSYGAELWGAPTSFTDGTVTADGLDAVFAVSPVSAGCGVTANGMTGKTFTVTYTLTGMDGADQARIILYGDGTVVTGAIHTANGTYTETLTVTTAGGSFTNQIRCQAHSGGTMRFSAISVREVITTSSVTAGLPTNNYTLSDGSTGYSAVDGTAGLVLDGAGVSSQIVPLIDTFTFTAAGSTPPTASSSDTFLGSACVSVTMPANTGGYSVCRADGSGGAARHTITAGRFIQYTYTVALSRRLTGGERVKIYSTGQHGSSELFLLTSASPENTWIDGASSMVAGTTGDNYPAVMSDSVISAPVTVYLRQYSVKQVTGIHATQSTTANKPALRRGLYNLLTYSQDFINNWSAAATKIATTGPDGTLSATLITTTGGSFNNSKSLLAPSSVVTVCAIVGYGNTATGTTPGLINSYGIYSQTLARDVAYAHVNYETGEVSASGPQAGSCTVSTTPYADGWHLIAITIPAGIAAGDSIYCYMGGVGGAPAAGESFRLWRGGFFAGALTAAQILAEGGIPLTLASAASNSGAGRYWHQYTAANSQYMNLASVPFQLADDFLIVGAARFGSPAAWSTLFSASGATTTPRIQLFCDSATGFVRAYLRDDAGVNVNPGGAVDVRGTSVVATLRKVGTNVYLRVNGVQVATASVSTLGAMTLTGASIGRLFNGADHMEGGIGQVVPVKGTVSDADLLTLERWVASQTVGGPSF